MRRRLALAALAAAAAVSAQPARAQAQRDWTRIVVETPEGGFRMGNPDAPVKVVEYLSLTCPRCADFARRGAPALIRDYVRSGRVSLEYRNYVLNEIDATATLLARCSGPTGFFAMTGPLYMPLPQWYGRIQGIDQAQRDALTALEPGERRVRMAQIGGLDTIAAQYGVSARQGRRCLTDEAALNRLRQMVQAASALGVQGTPTFFINGEKQDASEWSALEPQLRAALGR